MNTPESTLNAARQPASAKSRGFTLIELITVIVILSIIAVIGSQFISSSAQSYNQTQTRAKLTNKSRQALERITRQLRGAVPNSIQITAGGNCIKFLPLAAGGYYLNPVPDIANGAAAANTISTAGYEVTFGTARYALIGALNSGDIYTSGNAIASLAATLAEGSTGTTLTLASATIWQRNSLSRRFYLADNPQAFCITGSELHFLQGTGVSWTPSGTGSLMAQQATTPGTAFALESGTEDRNTIVTINLDFSEGGETINLLQQVHIRNVP